MAEECSAPDLKRALRISVGEGILAQLYGSLAGVGSIFLLKMLIIFGAGQFHFSVFAAIGQLSQVLQPVGFALTRKTGRQKPITLWLSVIGRAVMFLVIPLPFILGGQAAVWTLLAICMVSSSVLAIALNTWIAWVSNLFPVRIRGRFFSARSFYIMVAGLAAGYAFSLFFDAFEPGSAMYVFLRDSFEAAAGFFTPANLKYGFAGAFAIAGTFGIASVAVLSRQPERVKQVEAESFGKSVSGCLADPNFRRLMLYGAWWMLAIGIGAPYWGPFMLDKTNGLNMSLFQIQIYGTISTVSQLLLIRWWGRAIDRFGNKTVMRFLLIIGAINPAIWVIAGPDRLWMIYLEAATSGAMWSGANIVATNFVLSIAPRGKAQVYSGVFGAFSGLAMVLTMLTSGVFFPRPMDIFGIHLASEQVLFAITALGRLSTQIPLTFIIEPRAASVGTVLHVLIHNFKVRAVHTMVFLWKHRSGKD